MADAYWVIYKNEKLFENLLILKGCCHMEQLHLWQDSLCHSAEYLPVKAMCLSVNVKWISVWRNWYPKVYASWQ